MPHRPVPVYETQFEEYKKTVKKKDERTRKSRIITLDDI